MIAVHSVQPLSNCIAPPLVRNDPIHRVFAGQPHECGHYERERVETEDGKSRSVLLRKRNLAGMTQVADQISDLRS
jgi:hypothetical protein